MVEMPTKGIWCLNFGAHANLQETIANMQLFPWNKTAAGRPSNDPHPHLTSAELSPPFESWCSVECKQPFLLQSPIHEAFCENTDSEPEKIAKLDDSPDEEELFQAIEQSVPKEDVDRFQEALCKAVEVRCTNHHNVCKKCFARYVKHNEVQKLIDEGQLPTKPEHQDQNNCGSVSSDSDEEFTVSRGTMAINGVTFKECNHASTAILFSGGLDSTVIALFADRYVPKHLPIDLLNVAFHSDAPDRETGIVAWKELKKLAPKRKWNFVSIHISKEELEKVREKHIRYLAKPLNTVLDDSIACAIWFAAQGHGFCMQDINDISANYKSRARVVLLGMGADEQLGGYSRYRSSFTQRGLEGMMQEMIIDIERLSTRNLGRDDRITADHGIEARYPFLDEGVVNTLNSMNIWHKCNMNLERGYGEKILLRILARRLGLVETSKHLKRAIQFGSRIAKVNGSTKNGEKGSQVCDRLVCPLTAVQDC